MLAEFALDLPQIMAVVFLGDEVPEQEERLASGLLNRRQRDLEGGTRAHHSYLMRGSSTA
jgi:hypothetical protein